MHIVRTTTLTYSQTAQLHTLCKENAYEPFLDFDTPYYLALDKQGTLLGFLSYIIQDFLQQQEIEVTAIVVPCMRRQGIFHALFAALTADDFAGRNPQKPFVCITNRAQPFTAAAHIPLFSDYFMQLDKMTWEKKFSSNAFSLPEVSDYEVCYTEKQDAFLLYASEEDAEPSAVCNLDYSATHTSLYGVFVDENKRGQGLGSLLFYELLCDYFDNHTLPLLLHVRSTNTSAVHLYRKCGFSIAKQLDFYELTC